ncbi:hypothetical protein MNBD_GAMMA12-159 [hydrothermal vent metagenome]|uniref:DUF4365 domain-containing protein n=1 Tax=hydrothermal vent metagenome TaxID=652676 RepID=A0A3B0YC70_9ZZZZ
MSLFDMEKLYAETRSIAARFRHTMGKNIGGITSELAAYDAARFLGLELCNEQECGYNAIGVEQYSGQKILIKGRAIFKDQKSRQRLGQIKLNIEWDIILVVLLDDNFEPQEIYLATRTQITDILNDKEGAKQKGPMSVAKFKAISKLVWCASDGLIT